MAEEITRHEIKTLGCLDLGLRDMRMAQKEKKLHP